MKPPVPASNAVSTAGNKPGQTSISVSDSSQLAIPVNRKPRFDLPAPTVPDHTLLCLIGRGAYGEVWLARNAIGTLRAVKIVHRQSFQRAEHFEREFRGLLKFEPISRSHDGLVDVLQIGRRDDAGYFYYVMELADDGGENQKSDAREQNERPNTGQSSELTASLEQYAPHTLRSELQHRTSLPSTECVTLGLKLASALEHLHSNGLVHRDIKPSNIIFVNGEPKLADIGLVTAIDEAQSLVGTVGYIPPEGPGTAQADLYSLGKVLYEITFGKDRQEFPQLPPGLQSHPDYAALLELNEIILKACETNPGRRYQSAREATAELALLQDGKSVMQTRTFGRRLGMAKKVGLAVGFMTLLVLAAHFVKSVRSEYTPKPEALRLYDLGRWHYSQLTPEDHGKAYKYLTQAVQVDPKFVRPYGELMALYTWYFLPREEYSERARLKETKEIADKALAIDPDAAEGHAALSWCKFLERDWHGAEEEIKRAIKLNPGFAIAHDVYSFYLSMLGRTEEARREGHLAQELEPPGSERVTAIIASWPYMAERRFDLAITQLKRVLELDPNFTYGHSFLGVCYDAQSNHLAAIEEFSTFATLIHQDATRVASSFGALRQAYVERGEQGYLQKWIELIRADQSLPDNEQMFVENDVVGHYARLGENGKALDELEKHFDEPQVWHQIKFKAMYDSLHDEPRFNELVKRAGLEK